MSDEKKDFPTALEAPDTDVTPLTLTMAGDLLAMSRESPRKRIIQCFHKSPEDGVHRMFNALQPGTYVTPHRHMSPPKSETLLVVSGSLLFVEFTDDGQIKEQTLVQPGTEAFGVDVAPHVYHSFIALKPDTLLFEVKDGPYSSDTDKDFAPWAPREGTPEAEPYLLAILKELAAKVHAAAEEMKREEGPEAGQK